MNNKGQFIGLYDKHGKPMHDGDKYKTLSILDQRPLGGGDPWTERIEEVKYTVWGDNAGYSLPSNRELI